jgi:hypothetical protein
MPAAYSTFSPLKLKPYAKIISNQPPPAASKPSKSSAADILGLKRQRTGAKQGISLENEVDQYLSNPEDGTGILEFWQVCGIF